MFGTLPCPHWSWPQEEIKQGEGGVAVLAAQPPASRGLRLQAGPLSLVGFSVQEPSWGTAGLPEAPPFRFPSSQLQHWVWGSRTHRGEAAPVLPDDGTEAQEAGHHDKGAREDEDVGRGGEGAGGQDAEVAALLRQRPDTHGQDGGPPHLQEARVRAVAPRRAMLHLIQPSESLGRQWVPVDR